MTTRKKSDPTTAQHDLLSPGVSQPESLEEHFADIEAAIAEEAEKIVEEAHREIERKYDPQTGEAPKPYHNLTHTKEVETRMDALIKHPLLAKILQSFTSEQWGGKFGSLPDKSKLRWITMLSKLMASSHDVIVDRDARTASGLNEVESAQWLVAMMEAQRKSGSVQWSNEEKELAKDGILSTATKIIGDGEHRFLQQAAPLIDPDNIAATSLKNLLALMLCDADLGALGSEWEVYWKNTQNLFREAQPRGTLEDWEKFLGLQIPILRNHSYYTPMAEALWSEVQREKNATRVQTILASEEKLKETFEEIQPHR